MGTEPHCAVLSDTVQVAFHPRPAVPVITRNGNTLTSTVADAYQWRDDSGDLPGATSRSYTATKNGRYAVMVTNSFGCSAVSDTVYVTLVGVEEARAEDFSVDVYPNPSRGVFTLSCSAGDRQQLRLTVRDLLGRVVSQRPLQHDGVHTLQRIDLSALPEGMYFLRLESAVVQHTRMLLLRRE
jgi:hypothetical protein